MYSRITSRTRGTETNSETRRFRIWRTISRGSYPWTKTVTPGSIGGMKVAIACPNIWLRGSRLRKRIGLKGAVYFLYLAISRSIGTMFARMLRWVMRTPLGSAVAPDVKMISALVSAVTSGRGGRADDGSLFAG